jgi:polyphosphate kinase 2 (PPK2 family)
MVKSMDKRLHFMTDLIGPLLVEPGSTVKLGRDHDPRYTGPVAREEATALLAEGVDMLAKYQDRLAAQDTFGVLLVLQGLDASGKDGTIKHVMSGLNPQGVSVRAFKQPSAEELNHDFLWRYQCALRSSTASTTREELEILAERRPGAAPLGRLPARLR